MKQAEYVPGIPVVPSSIIRMGSFVPPGQVNPLPPFVMHPQSAPQPASSNSASLSPHNMDTFQATTTRQYLQNQQVLNDLRLKCFTTYAWLLHILPSVSCYVVGSARCSFHS